MGLDMYAYKRKDYPGKPVDFEPEDSDEQFAYWRKHPNTHGWMEQLYRHKGGKAGDFNLVPVVLTGGDLDAFEKAVNGNELPETTGFFFGQSHPDDKATDLQFIKDARQAIEDGYTVFYTSWW